MAKDPAFLFYTNDFDSKTKFFTHEQVGMYLRLLMAEHQNGRMTKEQMIYICGRYDNHVFSKFTIDSGGLYFNERLEEEIDRRRKYSKSRSLNRKGNNEEDMSQHMNDDMNNISSTHENHMLVHMETEIETTVLGGVGGIGFDIFWKAYPKKKSKGAAEKWWKKNKPSKELLIKIIASIGKLKQTNDWRKDGGQFIPHPATWLNAKGWEDETGAEAELDRSGLISTAGDYDKLFTS